MSTDLEKTFSLPVITLVLLSFCLGTSEFIVIGILPDISSGLNVSLTMAGSLVSIFAIVYAVGTPFAAAFAGLFNKFGLIITLTIIFLIGNILCIFAPNYQILVVARIVIAIVSGTLLSVSMAFVPDIVSEKKRAPVVAWIYAGFSIASVFGVPVGTLISHSFGWRYSF
ncbi:MAG: MFS transporter, partial [Candidatus Mucispirillum faecigallinarum]|nr:MFS transporter [Candidatus Mucispirillum faecigallinarum]